MSTCDTIFPVFLYHEKDDAPLNYLFSGCEGEVGDAFQRYDYTYDYRAGRQSFIDLSQSSYLSRRKAKASITLNYVDNYGNIITTLIYTSSENSKGNESLFKLFCCNDAESCEYGQKVSALTQNAEYTVIRSNWDPCYTFPNGNRGTWSNHFALSTYNQNYTWNDPCGGDSIDDNRSCTRDFSEYPDRQTPEGCGLIGGVGTPCRFADEDVVHEPSFPVLSSYHTLKENTDITSKVTSDSFYSQWMKESAKRIIDIKENNNKKNCCPGYGFPKPCDDADWYDYPYSRPTYDAPEGSEFTEEFLDGNCWKGAGNIEIKNPKVNEQVRKIQAFKFSAGIDVTNLNDYELSQFNSISGQLIIYTPDPNYSLNDPEAPTPCCNLCGCFSGQIIESGFHVKFSKTSPTKKQQPCVQGLCGPVKTIKYADNGNLLYNDDLYSKYYPEWDETSPSFIVKTCVRII